MTTQQRLVISTFCQNLPNETNLRDRICSYFLDDIAALYTRRDFHDGLQNIRSLLFDEISNRFHLSKCRQLQLTHVPFINVNDLVNRAVNGIRRRL
jgi:hypothetical protein